jgi:hypothetical protein
VAISKTGEQLMMKIFNLSRFARAGALVLCLMALTVFSASAQNNNGNAIGATRTETRTVENDDTDWGWLGLAGLLGLLPKKRTVEVHENRTTNRT